MPDVSDLLLNLQTRARQARENADALHDRAVDLYDQATRAVERKVASDLTQAQVQNFIDQLTTVQAQIDQLVQDESNLANTLDGIATALTNALKAIGL